MCRSLSGRFIGDPTYEYEYIDMKVVGEGEEAEEETNTVSDNDIAHLMKNFIKHVRCEHRSIMR